MERKSLLVFLALALLLTPSFALIPIDGDADLQVIVDCLRKKGQFTIFLRHLNRSGFQAVLGKYLGRQAITLLVPTDAAFQEMPKRLTGRLVGKDRIQFIEFHMLRELWPFDSMVPVIPGGFYETVLSDKTEGPFVYKCNDPGDTICLSSQKNATEDSTAFIIDRDACGLPARTIGVQVINRVMIPPGVFATASA